MSGRVKTRSAVISLIPLFVVCVWILFGGVLTGFDKSALAQPPGEGAVPAGTDEGTVEESPGGI
ncbi:MAG TPA: hypothetical protein GX507_00485, partial [Clostridia bacterium]|nr:hypothetical protein [Clostridia bacterium]